MVERMSVNGSFFLAFAPHEMVTIATDTCNGQVQLMQHLNSPSSWNLCSYDCHLLCLYSFGAQMLSIHNNTICFKPLQLEKSIPLSKLHDNLSSTLFMEKTVEAGAQVALTVSVATFSMGNCLKTV